MFRVAASITLPFGGFRIEDGPEFFKLREGFFGVSADSRQSKTQVLHSPADFFGLRTWLFRDALWVFRHSVHENTAPHGGSLQANSGEYLTFLAPLSGIGKPQGAKQGCLDAPAANSFPRRPSDLPAELRHGRKAVEPKSSRAAPDGRGACAGTASLPPWAVSRCAHTSRREPASEGVAGHLPLEWVAGDSGCLPGGDSREGKAFSLQKLQRHQPD